MSGPGGVLANDSDADGSPLTAVLASGTSNGSLVFAADGSFSYTPNAGFNGLDSFTYRASDGASNSSLTTVTITVLPVNDAPTAGDDNFTIAEDGTLTLAAIGVLANDSDLDGDPLAALLVSGPSNGSVALNVNGSLTYRPNANFNGVDSFTYRASDGSANSGLATVTITVIAVNDAPAGSADAYAIDPGGVLNVAAGGVLSNDFDVEGDAITAVLVTGPAHGQLTFNPDGSFVYTAAPGQAGIDTFTYLARDGASDSNLVTVTITVGIVAPPPPLPEGGGTSPGGETPPDNTGISPQPLPPIVVTGPVSPGPAPRPPSRRSCAPKVSWLRPRSRRIAVR